MSIIIRLQNLPLSAKAEDVRRFFGGLRIPHGGVHILGGHEGDAFIGFTTDEDARLAMKKDGGKIRDSRIHLSLSSHMEMQHEIQRITKKLPPSPEPPTGRGRKKTITKTSDQLRSKLPRSRSPAAVKEASPKRETTKGHRPNRSSSPEDSSSSFKKRMEEKELQKQQEALEKRITEALAIGPVSFNDSSIGSSVQNSFPFINADSGFISEYDNSSLENTLLRHLTSKANLQFPGHMGMNQPTPEGLDFPSIFSVAPATIPITSSNPFNVQQSNRFHDFQNEVPRYPGFYITMSGLCPTWNYDDIMKMFRCFYTPPNYVSWELDNHRCKTGVATLKLLSREDFDAFLSYPQYTFTNRIISVSECPPHVYTNCFPEEVLQEPIAEPDDMNLCYKMKGIHYYASHTDILKFFSPLQVSDLYMVIEKNGLMNGFAWVSFKTLNDHQQAFLKSGQKLGHRFVYLMFSNKNDMLKMKRKLGDVLKLVLKSMASVDTKSPIHSDVMRPPQKRALCAQLTGLPQDASLPIIEGFFNEKGLFPSAIHIPLSETLRPCGRAFVEFNNFRDFDAAIQCHGNSLKGNTISVRQILCDEMCKILATKQAIHSYGKDSIQPEAMLDKGPCIWQTEEMLNFSLHRFPDGESVLRNVQVFEYGNQSTPISSSSGGSFQPQAITVETIETKTLDNQQVKGKNIPQVEEAVKLTSKKKNRHEMRNRVLVKFEVKNQQLIPQVDKTDGAFVEEDPSNEKKKLTKLSPEKVIAQELKVSMPARKTELFSKMNAEKQTNGEPKVHVQEKPSIKKEEKPEIKEEKSEVKKEEKPEIKKEEKPTLKKEEKLKITKPAIKKEPESPALTVAKERASNIIASLNQRKQETVAITTKPKPTPLTVESTSYKASPPSRRSRSRSPRRRIRSRSPRRSPPSRRRYDYYDDEFNNVPAVVQMRNVHPVVGSRELVEFFCGFEVDPDQIIRRFGDYGEPLGDVRLTFKNLKEAKKAIINLSGCPLKGTPAEIFLV